MPGYSLNDIYGSYGSLDLGTDDEPKDELGQAIADAIFEKQVAKLVKEHGDDSFDFKSYFEAQEASEDDLEMPYGETDRILFEMQRIMDETEAYLIDNSPGQFDVYAGYAGYGDPYATETQEPAYTLDLSYAF